MSSRTNSIARGSVTNGKGSSRYADSKYALEKWRERKYNKLMSSRWKIWEKIMRHFPVATNARTDEVYELFGSNPGYWVKFLWKIVSRSQSTWNDSEFCCVVQPRQKIAASYMGSNPECRKTFLETCFLRLIHLEMFLEFHLTTCKEIEKQLLEIRRWKQAWQVKTDKKYGTIPLPMFASRPWLRERNIRLIFRRTTWSDSKDSKCRNCNSTGSVIHHHFWCGKQDSKHWSQVVLIFSRKVCSGSKKWRWLTLWMS